jgi:hypothetical protein
VRVGARVGDLDVVMAIALQRRRRDDLAPVTVFLRVRAVGEARLDRRGRREVAGEMARVDVDAADRARPRQLDDAEVVARRALAARFPAVHPLAVVVVLAGDELRRLRVEHALLRREEFVAREERFGAQPRICEIHVAARESGSVGVEDRGCHDGRFLESRL